MSASASGFGRDTLSDVVVEEGASVSGLVITLDAGGEIEGLVLSEDYGTPLGFATLSVVDEAGQPVSTGSSMTFTREDGSFRIEGLPEGRYEVVCTRSGFQTARRTVRVEAGEVAREEFRLAADES